jgi:hypothetical protein
MKNYRNDFDCAIKQWSILMTIKICIASSETLCMFLSEPDPDSTYVHMYICTYVHMYICTYDVHVGSIQWRISLVWILRKRVVKSHPTSELGINLQKKYGTDVMILKIFSTKKIAKKWRFWLKTELNYAKFWS